MRAVLFSAAERTLLMKLYKEYKGVIIKKSNIAAINKAREMAWQKKIADRFITHECNVLITQKKNHKYTVYHSECQHASLTSAPLNSTKFLCRIPPTPSLHPCVDIHSLVGADQAS